MNLLFADTETTGMAAEDRLCQVCFHINGLEVSSLFRPPVMIKSGAMAIHKITNAQVARMPQFMGSAIHLLLTHLQHNTIFVAHNAPFDLKMLEREGISFSRVIDTLKVSRHLDTGGTIASHALQNLRDHYQIDIEAQAHDALGDVKVMMVVFEHLMERLLSLEGGTRQERILRMIEISKLPSKNYKRY